MCGASNKAARTCTQCFTIDTSQTSFILFHHSIARPAFKGLCTKTECHVLRTVQWKGWVGMENGRSRAVDDDPPLPDIGIIPSKLTLLGKGHRWVTE